jgi:hypothetical protein
MLPSTTRPPLFRRRHHVVEKIVSDDGPAHFLPEQIHHQHIARLQHVDRRLIVKMRHAPRLGLGFCHFVHVGTKRHELQGKRAPDHGLVRMQDAEAVRILVLVAALLEDRPDFFGGKFACLAEQIVRHFGSPIGQAVKGIGLRIINQLLLRELDQLRFAPGSEQKGSRESPNSNFSKTVQGFSRAILASA